MDFAMAMHVLLFKNTKGVFPIEGFRLEMYLREFTRHCVILVLFRVFLCSLKGRWYERLTHWIKAYPELLSVILFSDEASFTRDGVNNLRNVYTWSHDNPHETSLTNFQRRFTVNVWCGVLGNKSIGPFVFENNLTGNAYEVFLRNDLPDLLEDIPLMIRSQIYFQHDGAPPHYTLHVRDYLNESAILRDCEMTVTVKHI